MNYGVEVTMMPSRSCVRKQEAETLKHDTFLVGTLGFGSGSGPRPA